MFHISKKDLIPLLIVMSFACFTLLSFSFRRYINFYYTPTDILTYPYEYFSDKNIRLTGLIRSDSLLKKDQKACSVFFHNEQEGSTCFFFDVYDSSNTVRVVYFGDAIDFKRTLDYEILLQGFLHEEIIFISNKHFYRHDENYQVFPIE